MSKRSRRIAVLTSFWIAFVQVAGFLSALAPLAVSPAYATCPAQFLLTTVGSDADCIFRDYNTDGVPASGGWNPRKSDIRALLDVISGFYSQGGVYGIMQNGLSAPGGAMSGYAIGDSVTLQCAGLSFSSPPFGGSGNPTIGVVTVSAGVITQAVLNYPGLATSAPAGMTATCTQASSSGGGTGYTVTATFGAIAAYVMPAALGTGGTTASNGNLFLNIGDAPTGINTGAENTFIGDKSGYGLLGASSQNAAVGHGACYNGMGGAIASSFNVCIGSDAGRNFYAGAELGGNTLVGFAAGRNVAGPYNTFIGSDTADHAGINVAGYQSGYGNTAVGYQGGVNLTSGVANTFLGIKAGSGVTSGGGNSIIAANVTTDVCSDGNSSFELLICTGVGILIKGAGGPTIANTIVTISGDLNIANLPTSAGGGGLYVCADATGTFYKKASCP